MGEKCVKPLFSAPYRALTPENRETDEMSLLATPTLDLETFSRQWCSLGKSKENTVVFTELKSERLKFREVEAAQICRGKYQSGGNMGRKSSGNLHEDPLEPLAECCAHKVGFHEVR